MLFVDGQVNRVFSEILKIDFLQIQDDILRQCLLLLLRTDIDCPLQGRHHMLAVKIDKIDRQAVHPFLDGFKTDAQRDGALLKDHGDFLGPNGVKGPEDVELALLIGSGITKTEDFNVDDDLLYSPAACPAWAMRSSILRMAESAPLKTARLNLREYSC